VSGPRYPLQTARLLLRPYTDADFDDLYDIQSRPDVARYMYWGPRDRPQAREALEQKL
jgi:RimJ/RimL family protein N-acetyltransferase